MSITDVYLVYNDINQIKRLGGTYTLKVSPFFHFIDFNSKEGKKEAWTLMNQYASKKPPFALIMNGEKPIKAFYTEADEDIIESLIKYLSNE